MFGGWIEVTLSVEVRTGMTLVQSESGYTCGSIVTLDISDGK